MTEKFRSERKCHVPYLETCVQYSVRLRLGKSFKKIVCLLFGVIIGLVLVLGFVSGSVLYFTMVFKYASHNTDPKYLMFISVSPE